jgi:hypothetical protein
MPSRKSQNPKGHGQAFPRVFSDPEPRKKVPVSGGAPTTKGSLFGLLFLVLANATILGLATRILNSAGALSWSFSAWDCIALSLLWVVWRAIDRLTAPKQP